MIAPHLPPYHGFLNSPGHAVWWCLLGHEAEYLDALVPMDDNPVSAADFYPPEEWEAMEAAASDNDGGWPMPEEHPGWIGITDEDAQWMRLRAVSHPLNTFRQEVTAENPDSCDLPYTYILCSANGMDDATLESIRHLCEQRNWTLFEIETGHWPMVSSPDQLADRLNAVP
jgi:hypothetical protein